MSIKNIYIGNFTVFDEFGIDCANGMNILIGENGTGKTHLMKAIYAVHAGVLGRIHLYFGVENLLLLSRDLESNPKMNFTFHDEYGKMNAKWDEYESAADQMEPGSYKTEELPLILQQTPKYDMVFIPAKDMLTHSKGFLSMYDKFDMPFDKTYYDIISKSLLPNLKEVPQIGLSILPKLEKIIGGKVIVENDTFFIEKTDGIKVEFSVEAEGIKKIAILWQLIMNESITEGTVLFWDEPEANINPSLVPDVVEILLELSRQGVQIFIATHDYIFAKYIEVLMKENDEVAFHALYKTENEGVKCETEKKFSLLSHNAIREENINLYDAEMKKEFEE